MYSMMLSRWRCCVYVCTYVHVHEANDGGRELRLCPSRRFYKNILSSSLPLSREMYIIQTHDALSSDTQSQLRARKKGAWITRNDETSRSSCMQRAHTLNIRIYVVFAAVVVVFCLCLMLCCSRRRSPSYFFYFFQSRVARGCLRRSDGNWAVIVIAASRKDDKPRGRF